MKTFKQFINEEGYDHYRDNILMRGGDHRSKETKNRSFTPSKPMKGQTAAQKAAKGRSALDIVKDNIRKRGEKIMGEAKYEAGASTYGKATIRNKRKFGTSGELPDPLTGKKITKDATRGELITKRREAHKEKRGVKTKVKSYHYPFELKKEEVGMKESMSGGVPMTPQELNIQKKMSQLNVRLARKRSQQLQKAKVQDTETSPEQVKEEGLRAWFGKSSGTTKSGRKVKGWVQVGGKYDGKPCARQPGQKTTPKCVSSSKRRSMSDKERDSAARRKRAADPGQPQKTGAAKPTMVSTDPKK